MLSFTFNINRFIFIQNDLIAGVERDGGVTKIGINQQNFRDENSFMHGFH